MVAMAFSKAGRVRIWREVTPLRIRLKRART
jgi:hypothetical protein